MRTELFNRFLLKSNARYAEGNCRKKRLSFFLAFSADQFEPDAIRIFDEGENP